MKKEITKAVLFLVMVGVIFCLCQNVFTVSNELAEHAEMMIKGFYETEENTVDVVLIGNSHIYRYWQGAFGWKQYGITGLNLSTSDMPCVIFKNMAKEALKTQTPKVIVFDALAFADDEELENNKIFYVTSNMKFSLNYLDTIAAYCDANEMPVSQRLAYYFPSIQFHARWKELNKRDFMQTKKSYLNSTYEKKFLVGRVENKTHLTTEKRVPIGKGQEKALRELLEWCKKQDKYEIEFISVPVLLDEQRQGMINYVGDIIEEYNVAYLNYNEEEKYSLFGFDEKQDFQDKNHTNVKGSYKFCEIYGRHLIEKYGLKDHRGENDYQVWQEKADVYMDMVETYMRDS